MINLISKGLLGATLITAASMSPAAFAKPDTKAFFCEDCTNYQEARARSQNHAAPMVCTGGGGKFDPFFSPNIECSRETRRVVMVNHKTNQKWAFIVEPTSDQQSLIVTDSVLTSNEHAGYQKAIDSYNTWLEAIKLTQDSFNSGKTVNKSSASCPANTALDVLRDPNKLNHEVFKAMHRLEYHLNNGFVGGGSCAEVLRGSVNASIAGVGYSVQATEATGIVRSVVDQYPPEHSEVGTFDRLAYVASSVSCDINGRWKVSMELDLNQSVVLGQVWSK